MSKEWRHPVGPLVGLQKSDKAVLAIEEMV